MTVNVMTVNVMTDNVMTVNVNEHSTSDLLTIFTV